MSAIMSVMIQLDTFEKIKRFINISSCLNYDIELISGRYVVDGKSIMGVLSLDLSKPLAVNIENPKCYPKELEDFMVGE